MKNVYCTNLFSRFSVIARERGDAIAIVDESGTSFSRLLEAANTVANGLAQMGIGRGDVVAIFHAKRSTDYALQLACLKIGAPYVVLDPENPAHRLRKIVGTCQPVLMIVHQAVPDTVIASLGEAEIKIADTHSLLGSGSASSIGKPLQPVIGTDIAYLMFTSGSTGDPKGVAISHAQVLNFCDWAATEIGVQPTDIFTAVNPPYFDNSVFDFYASLFNGAGLAPVAQEVARDPARLVARVNEAGCTVWFSVPSLLIFLSSMRALGPNTWPAMRAIVFGGEGYPMTEVRRLFSNFGSRCRLVNVYGPTECTCICSAYDVLESDLLAQEGLPPIGHLAPNFRGLLLEGDEEVEDGEVGELCLLGPNVSIGYYNDSERTAAAFVRNPLCDTHAETMYRTGDLMRVSPADGKLHFVGRKDNQIKHMGYRIELEEIEAAFHGVEGVVQSAVIYKRVKAQYGHIIAFVSGGPEQLVIEDLKSELRKRLPEYMIPNRIEIRDVLPKNANGKVDKKKLSEEA